jgi:predicted nucleotide-binding protein
MRTSFARNSENDWVEYDFDTVVESILKTAGNPDLDTARSVAAAVRTEFEDARHQVLSGLSTSLEERDDPFLAGLKAEAEGLKAYVAGDFLDYLRPTGQIVSRDMVALTQGVQPPPHLSVMVNLMEIRSPASACDMLARVARRSASHLARREQRTSRQRRIDTSIFIGHGRSQVWKDLKDFFQDRLGLGWDEFNRVPVAGITNITRLSEMLDGAAIAFLIMTAEDEQADGKVHARLNVVHEAGLFQGRLGFTKAIILLEDGCDEFSNIHGLGQIRFPKGSISAVFEEIRRVLEREGIVSA